MTRVIQSKLGIADRLILATARQVHGKVVTGDSDTKGLKETILTASKFEAREIPETP